MDALQRHRSIPRFAAVALLLTSIAMAANPAGRVIEGPVGKLYVEVRGTAPGRPLLVVNGGPGFGHEYLLTSPVWDELSGTRRVIMYDQRGTGSSTPVKPGTPVTLTDQLADLDAIRKSLGAQEVDLLGHSYGGSLVMAYTARFPDRVKRLVIVDSAAPKLSETTDLFKQAYPDVSERMDGFEFGTQLNDPAAIDGGIRAYLSMIFWSPDHRDAFLRVYAPGGFRRHVNEEEPERFRTVVAGLSGKALRRRRPRSAGGKSDVAAARIGLVAARRSICERALAVPAASVRR